MALAITEEHIALSDVVRSFATGQNVRALARQDAEKPPAPGVAPTAVYKRIADQGWAGLHLPEEYGGSGYGLAEAAIVLEGLGREIVPGPLLPTMVASALIAEVGTDEQRRALLPGLADGSVTASLSLSGDVAAKTDETLSGDAGPALGGVWASVHLVRVGDDIAVLGEGVRVTAVDGSDASLGVARVEVGGAQAAHVLAGAAGAAVRLLRTLAAAEAAGGSRSTLDAALDYAKVREQFGRTIGSFQAVKHHLANMLIASELGVATAWDAARVAPGDDAELAAAVAATMSLDAYLRNARMNIQIHGGIGFTWEHDAHLFLRRATALAALVGRAADDVAALTERGVRRSYGVALPPEAARYRKDAAEFVARYRETPEGDRRRLLVESGYLVPHWRKPWGREAGPVEQLVIEEEFAGLDVPNLQISGWVLLTLSQTATPEQIERWIKPGLLGEQVWCQLFSEPNAGSDAAAVRTRGVKVDGGWRVTGQKVWTSNAQNCQRGLATIRTGPEVPKHRGITMMAIDLSAPGVTVRPLREITGDAMFNEVFFDDVFVPDEDVVGEPGAGWAVARATLSNERVTIGGSRRDGLQATDLPALQAVYAPDDTGLRRQVGQVVAEEVAMELINLRVVERAVRGAEPSAEGNVTKILSAEHAQRVSELAVSLCGPALAGGAEPEVARQYLFHRALTIAGGTSEVSRNVIAERILGLPREVIPK